MPRSSATGNSASVTIRSVADRCGYSTATVSRALNSPQLVTEAVRLVVQEAAAELGYVGNNAARALRQQRTFQFGAIIPTLSYSIYAGLLEALQKRCMRNGYTLMLCTSDYSLDNEADLGMKMIRSGVEGLVLVGNKRRDHFKSMLAASGIPTVNTYVYDPTCPSSTVGLDNHSMFRDSVSYLHEMGHRDFGLIIGLARDNDRVATRVAGFQAGLLEFGLPFDSSRVANVSYTIEDGRKGLRQLLERHPVTAVICGSDMLALGAIQEARTMGLDVPQDISILGGDDLDFSSLVTPAISTVSVPTPDIGIQAADYLMARRAGSKATLHVKFDTKLLVRESTGPAKAKPSRRR